MTNKIHITDQIGQDLVFNSVPKRLVSLVPSITYLLSQLGLEQEVVGLTRFCKLPRNWKKDKTIVGGTKAVNSDKILALKPDIFLASKEENTQEIVRSLQKIAPVYVSDVSDLDTNEKMIEDFGLLFEKEQEANQIIYLLNQKRVSTRTFTSDFKKRTVYLIWKDPWMTIGGDTFINAMLSEIGFDNIFKSKKRYPEISLKALQQMQPELILLASEPYPFKLKDQIFLQKLFPESCILLVEGEPFTWFGSYPIRAFEYFKTLQKQLQLCTQESNS